MSMEKGEKAKGWTEPELKNIGSKIKARGEKNENQFGSKRNKKKKKNMGIRLGGDTTRKI